jgi:Zn-dependent M28 family amino/carboxypeptidase
LLGLARILTDLWLPLPPGIWSGLRWALLTLTAIMACFKLVYLIVTGQSALSPGANDNGSGVGVVLAACQHLATQDQRLRHLRLRWAAWAAEERGMVGSSAYARNAELDPESTWALNLDMVGTGASMSLVRGIGLIPFRRTSRHLNSLLDKSLPPIQRVNYFARSSDFKPFLLQGIPAASITGNGGRRNWYYHTMEDTMEHVQRDLLGQAWQAVVGLACRLDEELSEGEQISPDRD